MPQMRTITGPGVALKLVAAPLLLRFGMLLEALDQQIRTRLPQVSRESHASEPEKATNLFKHVCPPA